MCYRSQVVGPCSQSFYWMVVIKWCDIMHEAIIFTSGVCLQARDCIGNTWSHQSMDNLEMYQQITYRRYVQQGITEEVGLLRKRYNMRLWCLLRDHPTYVGMSAPCTFLFFG